MYARKNKLAAVATSGILTAVSLAASPAAAWADESGTLACQPDPYIKVAAYGSPTYSGIGSTAGKYNADTVRSTLSFALSLTTSRSTSWSVGGSASVDWGIAQIEANTNYNVTKTSETGKTVTNTMSVPGHYYGYTQPKVEYRRFTIKKYQTPGNCGPDYVTVDYGIMNAITAVPFFAECVATSACTPKP